VHIDDLLIKLVEMVLCYPAGSHDINPARLHDINPIGSHDISPAERELDPSHMAIHLIKEVAQGNEMCQEILCKVEPNKNITIQPSIDNLYSTTVY